MRRTLALAVTMVCAIAPSAHPASGTAPRAPGAPAVRDLQLVVSDGRTFADVERDATTHRVRLLDRRSLTYRQIDTGRSYRIVKTYVTDPARSTLLIRIRVVSLTH